MPRSTRRTLLYPILLLLIFATGCSKAFSSRQTECAFPTRWVGTWFQSGVRQPILVSGNILSSKGRCLHNEGDKFLLVDEKSCYRCVVIHEKHSNVLQYKETYCQNRNSLASLCSYITGDALLYSMFREEAPAVPCPFRGPMTFSYNRGHGTCSSPQSNVDTCTDDSRLLFKYQACPDVPASESAVEELECLATWKEGSSRYLVGRLHHGHSSSNEDRYRCFVYERAGQSVGVGLSRSATAIGISTMDHELGLPGGPIPEGSPEIYRVAQSGDATCNGLSSPMEGSRTMTLTKISSPSKCHFPNWLTGHTSSGLTWHTLDLARSYTFHPRNASLHVTRSNSSSSSIDGGAFDPQDYPAQDEQEVKILCNSIKQTNPGQTMTTMVAHFTVGCRSGFMCMAFYRRDGHVVEVQTGSAVSRPEEACSSPYYVAHSVPYLTLVTSSPESRTCPYLGKFTVTGVNRNQRNTRDSRRNVGNGQSGTRRERDKVRHSEDRRGRKLDFEAETRRANNEYLVHDRQGRRARSDRSGRNSADESATMRTRSKVEDGTKKWSNKKPNIEDMLRDLANGRKVHSRNGNFEKVPFEPKTIMDEMDLVLSGKSSDNDDLHAEENREIEYDDDDDVSRVRRSSSKNRRRRNPKMEDFQVDMDDFAQVRQFWAPKFDQDPGSFDVSMIREDYFGDYEIDEEQPRKRSTSSTSTNEKSRDKFFLTYRDLVRIKRDLEIQEGPRDDGDDIAERRDKREEDEPTCNSEVTTLTVGCSTADRMEFRSDCVDDDAITAYSCHGRWFDAEGTQFVIATPLARRSSWSNDNNRPQPYRNSRRLCFMYRESGGVVSLTASPVACQREIPPPPPMLAFNATSIGQCMEDSSSTRHGASCIVTLLTFFCLGILR